MQPPINVFISYADADQELCKELEAHLGALERSGAITVWQSQKVPAGTDREAQMSSHLNDADLVLLLISSDFISSEYYWKQVKPALQRPKTESVIPVLLRPADWRNTELKDRQVLPANGIAVTLWENLDAAFEDVVQGIQRAAKIGVTEGTGNVPLLKRGEAALRRRDYTMAQREIERALEQLQRDPEIAQAYFLLALVHLTFRLN